MSYRGAIIELGLMMGCIAAIAVLMWTYGR